MEDWEVFAREINSSKAAVTMETAMPIWDAGLKLYGLIRHHACLKGTQDQLAMMTMIAKPIVFAGVYQAQPQRLVWRSIQHLLTPSSFGTQISTQNKIRSQLFSMDSTVSQAMPRCRKESPMTVRVSMTVSVSSLAMFTPPPMQMSSLLILINARQMDRLIATTNQLVTIPLPSPCSVNAVSLSKATALYLLRSK